MAFHRDHYHPSNAYAYFYGDDDPQKRLEILDAVFSQYEPIDVTPTRVPLQARFTEAKAVRTGYPASDRLAKGMFTVNWLLAETSDPNLNLALHILEHILIGLPGSPLKKALTDSGLGDDLAGVGLEADMRQMFFSVGLKGMHPSKRGQGRVHHLPHHQGPGGERHRRPRHRGRRQLRGVLPAREQHRLVPARPVPSCSRPCPPGSMTTRASRAIPWPCCPSRPPCATSRRGSRAAKRSLRSCWRGSSCTTRTGPPCCWSRTTSSARKRPRRSATGWTRPRRPCPPAEIEQVMADAAELKRLQAAPDDPEALRTIPRLTTSDLPAENRPIPTELRSVAGARAALPRPAHQRHRLPGLRLRPRRDPGRAAAPTRACSAAP